MPCLPGSTHRDGGGCGGEGASGKLVRPGSVSERQRERGITSHRHRHRHRPKLVASPYGFSSGRMYQTKHRCYRSARVRRFTRSERSVLCSSSFAYSSSDEKLKPGARNTRLPT